MGVGPQGSMSNPSRVSWLRWGELGLGGLLGLELFEGVECLVESESGWVRDIQPEIEKKRVRIHFHTV